MDGRRCRRRRLRGRLPTEQKFDTSLLHERLRRAVPLELHAHVSRVACCVVITETAMRLRVRDGSHTFCLVSGDAVGNLSVFYMSVPEMCAKVGEELGDDASTQRLRIRPDVRCRGAHRGSVNCMHHLKGTTLLLTGGDDGALRLWDVREAAISESKLQCNQEFLFHSSCVLGCTSDASQTIIASTGLDGVVALWLINIPIPLLTVPIGGPCTDVSFIESDPSLIQVVHEGFVSTWDLRAQPHYLHFQRALSAKLVGHRADATAQKLLYTSFPDEHELSWTFEPNTLEKELMRFQVSGLADAQTTQDYDETRSRYIQAFLPHDIDARLLQASFIAFGSLMITSATDLTHKLWNLESRKGVASLECPGRQQRGLDQASSVLVAPGLLCNQQRYLYGADDRGSVHVWDLRSTIASLQRHPDTIAHPTHSINGHAFFVTSIALSSDNTILVTGDASGKLHVRVAVS